MKNILKQALYLLLFLLLLYSAILYLSLLLVPEKRPHGGLDSEYARTSFFLTEPKYIFLNRNFLDTPKDKIILMGASNVKEGMRPELIRKELPGIEINNLGIGSANVTEVSQIVDMVLEVQTPETRRHNTFVIGIWYGMFADDKVRWYTPDRVAGDTDMDIERYRYGFYYRSQNGPVAILPPRDIPLGVTLIHPYLVLDWIMRDINKKIQIYFARAQSLSTDEERNAIILTEAKKQEERGLWDGYMGHTKMLSERLFLRLRQVIENITASGGRVLIVDLPVPAWNMEGSPYYTSYKLYEQKLEAWLKEKPGTAFMQMRDLANETEFVDGVHPKPRIKPVWAKRLAAAVKAMPPASLPSAK